MGRSLLNSTKKEEMMEDIIKALQILFKYGNPHNPFHCEHDTLYVWGIDPSEVSDADKKELDRLGFFEDEDGEGFISYRFGSC